MKQTLLSNINKSSKNHIYAALMMFCLLSINESHAKDQVAIPVISDGHLNQSQRIRGQLRARQFAVISAGLSAKLIRFSLSHGDKIKKGQQIAQFDCRIKQAEQAVINAKLNAASTKFEINQKLSSLNNISQLEVSQSEADVFIMTAELKKIEATLSECQIKAPFAGMITQKHVQPYQYVRVGEPLLELVDTRNLEVEMVIPSQWLSWLGRGATFNLTLDEINSTLDGNIDRIVGIVDPVSQTLRIIGVLKKPVKNLLPGMSGEVTFTERKQ
jgi:membrane fusion protein, multidrug efflux system